MNYRNSQTYSPALDRAVSDGAPNAAAAPEPPASLSAGLFGWTTAPMPLQVQGGLHALLLV